MAWAKRFGGPARSARARASRGVTSRVARCPSGLKRGPGSTRATKPKANGTVGHRWPKAMVTTP